MKNARRFTIITLGALLTFISAVSGAAEPGVNPDEALARLTAGNQRFAGGRMTHPNQSAERRSELANTQHPFAVVVSCSDSRVSPEIVFDEGIGDLFVVRTAGNRLDDLVLGSIEYAVDHLGCSLVVVLGHERCGAVAAAIDATKESSLSHENESAVSHVAVLLHTMQDAVAKAKDEPGDRVENTVVENIRIVVADLPARSPLLAERVKAGTLRVIGLRYDLDTGVVSPVESNAPGPPSKEKK